MRSTEISLFGSVIYGLEKIASENNYSLLIYQISEFYEYKKKGFKLFCSHM
jgi:LacI family transcriptional regulator